MGLRKTCVCVLNVTKSAKSESNRYFYVYSWKMKLHFIVGFHFGVKNLYGLIEQYSIFMFPLKRSSEII